MRPAGAMQRAPESFQSFREFWPFYLREHSLGATRRLHFVGTLLALLALALAPVLGWWLCLLVPVAGYGFAWYAHFFVEGNRPATFRHPAWSLAGDLRMFWLMLRGRMPAELRRHELGDSPASTGVDRA